jgi:hypothetical protein
MYHLSLLLLEPCAKSSSMFPDVERCLSSTQAMAGMMFGQIVG